MNRLYTCLFIYSCLVIAACKKDSAEAATLTGKWKVTGHYYSIGVPMIWYPVEEKANHDYVQFNNDGKLNGTSYTGYVRYVVQDSEIVIFYTANDTKQNYYYTLKGDTLTLSPAGPIYCTEGCSTKYVKVKN